LLFGLEDANDEEDELSDCSWPYNKNVRANCERYFNDFKELV